MLDIPKLGMELLSHAMDHVLPDIEDADECDLFCDTIENCRMLVDRHSPVKQALTQHVADQNEYLRREREIVQSAMEVQIVKRMR
jgi:hypothetical protein